MKSRNSLDVAMGHAVRSAIAQAGLTQAQACIETGMAVNTFNRRLNASTSFTWPELVAIAEATGITAEDLIARAQNGRRREQVAV